MLSEKPWKSEAILRLFLGVVGCIFLGEVVLSAVRFAGEAGKVNAGIYYGLVLAAAAFLAGVVFLVRRPWPLEKFTRYFLGLLVCLYLGLTFGYFAQHFATGAGGVREVVRVMIAVLSFQGAALVLIWSFLREHRMPWTEAFGLRHEAVRALLLGAAIACLYLPLGWSLQWASAQALSLLGANPQAQEAVRALKNTAGWTDRLVFGVTAVTLVPVAEEMLFRGILYPALKQAGFRRAALWSTSLLFAAVHLNLPAFVPLLLLAVALTLVYERTNNLLAPIAAHSLFNAANFVMLYWIQNPSGRPAGS